MIEKLNQNPDLIINIALIGIYPENEHQRKLIWTRIKRVLDCTISSSAGYNSKDYGYSDKAPAVHFLTSPALINEELISELKEKHYPASKYICVSEEKIYEDRTQLYDVVTVIGKNDNPYISGNAILRSWICDQADFAIVINDDANPLYIDFIKQCKNVGIPAANIYPDANRHMLWVEKSFYESFEEQKVKNYLDSILNVKTLITAEEEEDVKDYKLLWGNLYSKYMRRNKAAIDTSKPAIEDTLANPEKDIVFQNPEAKEIRDRIVGWFKVFDGKANVYGEKYHASIYLRAIMPLVTSILLAFGFYTETLFGFWPIHLFDSDLTVAALIAGFGFLSTAFLYLYIFRLSDNSRVKSWHKSYTDNRYIAETLRMAVHFIPYGIPVNYSIYNRYGTKEENTRMVIHRLRNFLKGIDLPNSVFNKEDSSECLEYLDEFLTDQIEYHKRSANRFTNIILKLRKYYKAIFYIGFIIGLFRGVLQIYTTFAPIPGEYNHLEFNKWVENFTNMLALLLPAWAAYFNSKLTLCNFEGLYHNDVRMIEGLNKIKQRITDEKQKEYLNYQDIYYISKDVNALMLGEISEWYFQINSKEVTRL